MLALSLAGCHASSPPIIKIGLIAPFEELYRADGYAALQAVKLAVAERNAAGGVAGHQVALVALNDNGRPGEAALQAAKLVLDAQVAGVIGPLQGATARAAAAELAAAGLPWIAPLPLDGGYCQGGFGLFASPERVGQAAMAVLIDSGVRGPVAVFAGSAAARAGAEETGKAAGLAVTAWPLPVDPALALPDGASAAVWLGDAAGGARLAQLLQARRPAGGLAMVGGPELASPIFAGRAAGAAHGAAYLSSGPTPEEIPAAFASAYEKLAGVQPGPQAVLAYDAAVLLLDALDQAASLARQDVYQAILTLGQTGWNGLSGRLIWSEAQDGCQQWRDGPLQLFFVQTSPS